MAPSFPKIIALDKPAIADCFGVGNSPLGFFLAAWQNDILVRLTLLPAHSENDVSMLRDDYDLPVTAPQDNARAKALVNATLFDGHDWRISYPKDLKLGFHGTAFQYQALQQMLAIPSGQTISYNELAARAGAVGAARAAGSVCARNPLPFLIPCHRILAAGGALGNYAFGTALKRQLLSWEKAAKPA